MAEQPFSKSDVVTLDSTGYGFISVTCPNGYAWVIDSSSVSTNAPALSTVTPVASVYEGTAPSPVNYIEGSYDGNRDTSDTVHRLGGGESLTAEWVGGIPGTTATFRVSGIQKVVR